MTMTPYLSVPQQDLVYIHETAVLTLLEIGIKTDHTWIRERLADRGCRVEGERVFIPPELVDATLREIPNSFKVYGRQVEQYITVGLDNTYGINTGIFANIYDFESGRIRRSTLDDVRKTTRLLDAMENLHAVYVSLVDANEVAPHMATVSDFAAVVANTMKPLIGPGVTNRAEAETIVNIARAVRGGDSDQLKKFPVCVPFICPISPLFFPKDIVDALVCVAESGLPIIALTNPVMGLTAPYAIASTVALGHAEVLASAVIAHTVSPGLPILNQNTPSVADMRTLASTTGGPETGLIRQMSVSLSNHLGMPSCAHGHTSSTGLDYQAAAEKTLNGLLIALARPSLLGGLGGLANATLTSYESILLDNEGFGAIFRTLAGVQVDKDHLAFDTLRELADTGNVLTNEHTLRYLYSNEVWAPQLALRQGLVGGTTVSEDSIDRARAETRRLLDMHTVEPLEKEIQLEINSILDTYDRSHTAG
jgi:trimethylamine--corrinoid protein Co-methyltransferase